MKLINSNVLAVTTRGKVVEDTLLHDPPDGSPANMRSGVLLCHYVCTPQGECLWMSEPVQISNQTLPSAEITFRLRQVALRKYTELTETERDEADEND